MSIAQIVRLTEDKAVKGFAVRYWQQIRKANEHQAKKILDALASENLAELKKIIGEIKTYLKPEILKFCG